MLGNFKDYYIGEDALAKRGVLKITKPIEDGVINNFFMFKAILHHLFGNELRVLPQEHPVLLT